MKGMGKAQAKLIYTNFLVKVDIDLTNLDQRPPSIPFKREDLCQI